MTNNIPSKYQSWTYDPYGGIGLEGTIITQYEQLLEIYPKSFDIGTQQDLLNTLVGIHSQANYIKDLLYKLESKELHCKIFINHTIKLITSLCLTNPRDKKYYQIYHQSNYYKLALNHHKLRKKLGYDTHDRQSNFETWGEYLQRKTTNVIGKVLHITE